jgi:hypothetical protein
MARCYARWRIHYKPPSWLRPRQEMAHSLPSTLNVGHRARPVKPSINFLLGQQTPFGSAFPQWMSVPIADSATPIGLIHTSIIIRSGTTKRIAAMYWPCPIEHGHASAWGQTHLAGQQLGDEFLPLPGRRSCITAAEPRGRESCDRICCRR